MEKINMKILCIIDCQNDFITGALGSPETQAIVPYVCEKIQTMYEASQFKRDKLNIPGPDNKYL